MNLMHDHFTHIANRYGRLRTTDDEPIRLIHAKLDGKPRLEAADVGCGVGRYVEKLFDALGDRLFLYCIDENEFMLASLKKNLNGANGRKVKAVRAVARALPLSDESLDFLMTFNAVHHFDLPAFLSESARVLRQDGLIFVYTRLRSQNKNSIWGKYFPGFNEKETRLYEINEFLDAVGKEERLALESIEFFRYKREASLERLLEQVSNHHYSTFSLYSEEELERAIEEFKRNIERKFSDTSKVRWYDENIMFILRKESSGKRPGRE